MFSFSKLGALAAIIGAVLMGFRLYQRFQETRSTIDAAAKRRDQARAAGPKDDVQRASNTKADTVDLVKDETGAFVPRDQVNRND